MFCVKRSTVLVNEVRIFCVKRGTVLVNEVRIFRVIKIIMKIRRVNNTH